MSRILIVTALHREIPDRFENPFFDCNILFTGVGKVNATYNLTKVLTKDRFDLVKGNLPMLHLIVVVLAYWWAADYLDKNDNGELLR